MLFKLFVKKIWKSLGWTFTRSSNFSEFRWSYFYRLSSFEFAFCSGKWFSGHLFWPSFYDGVHGLCDWPFYAPVATTYNVWGQLICMLLIQIGGLGLMTFIGVFYIQGKQKLSLRSRETIQESFSYGESKSLKSFMRSIFWRLFWWRAWELFFLVSVLFLSSAGDEAFLPLSF